VEPPKKDANLDTMQKSTEVGFCTVLGEKESFVNSLSS